MPCDTRSDGVTICRPGAIEEIVRDEIETRWCFVCRARRMFVYVVAREVGPSWYEPNQSIRCATSDHIDGDLFPGRAREWED